MAVNVGTAQGYLDLDISGFVGALQEANAMASKQMKSISTNFSEGFKGLGDTISGLGKTLTASLTTPIIGVGAAATKITTTFDSSMSKVQALSGATGEEFDKLRTKAQDMGASTRYSASEAADALGYMALAGWDTEQMVEGLDGVLNLAAASNMDLAQASDMVTDFLSAFGLEAKDAAKMADQMAYAQAHANTTTAQLGEAFGNSAANMASAGQTMETTTALLEAMANQGTKGSEAGTALAAIMRDLTNSMKDGAIQIGETSIAVQDQDGNFRSLIDILADVEKATDGMGTAQKTAALSSVFTAHSIRGVNQVLMEGTDSVKEYESALFTAGGTAKTIADTMLDNLNGQLTILKSALEGVAIEIGDILMPYLKQFVSWVQQLTDKFASLSTEEKEQVVKIALMVAAIGPALLIIGKTLTGLASLINAFKTLSTSLGAIKGGLSGLTAALGGVSAPILAVVAAIAVLVGAFATLWKTNEDFRNNIISIWNNIKAKFEEFANGISERLGGLGTAFKNITDTIWTVWSHFCELLAPVFTLAFEQISNIVEGVLDAILGILDVFIGIFTGDWEKAFNGLGKVVKSAFKLVIKNLKAAVKSIGDLLNVILGWFGTSWQDIWKEVTKVFKKAWNEIVKIFGPLANSIKQVATTVFGAVQSFLVTVWNTISDVVITTVTAIRNVISTAWSNIQAVTTTVFQGIFTLLSSGFTNIQTIVTTVFGTIWNVISTTLQNISTVLGTILTGIMTIIQSTFGAILALLQGNTEQAKQLISNAWQAILNIITTLVNSIRNVISTVFNGILTVVTTVMSSVQNIISTIWNTIQTVVSTVVNAISNVISSVFNGISSIISSVMNTISSVISTIWNGIKDTISNILNGIKSTAENVWDKIKTSIVTAAQNIKEQVVQWFDMLKDGIVNSINSAKDLAVNAMTAVKDAIIGVFDNIKDTFYNIGVSIVTGLGNGIKSVGNIAVNGIKSVGNNIIKSAKGLFGIHSPSRVFNEEIGQQLPPGMAEGFEEAIPKAEKDMNKEMDNMIDDLTGKEVDVGLVSNMKSGLDVVGSYFESLESRIIDSVTNMKESLMELVKTGQMFINPDGSISYVGYNGFKSTPTDDSRTEAGMPDDSSKTEGNTYIFNSPKPIDEIEAARLLKQTQRDISEGF